MNLFSLNQSGRWLMKQPALILTAVFFFAAAPAHLWAEVEPAGPVAYEAEPLPETPKLGQVSGPNDRTFMGGGLGLVFTQIPIRESEFTAVMSEFHYGWYLTDPNDFVRTAATIGLYGFAVIIPVPKVTMEAILGDPKQDVQGKLGISGFYDIAVGGHGGMAVELGLRFKNRVDVSLFTVPVGSDASSSYLDFLGVADTEKDEWTWDEDKKERRKEPDGIPDYDQPPHVIMPYFGIFVGINY